ncbi:hypothetical protein J6590_012847 [Homalodisca vitripennis]|nr:hypothetical protein J6590_012847 [Homalodisca vitripennis]
MPQHRLRHSKPVSGQAYRVNRIILALRFDQSVALRVSGLIRISPFKEFSDLTGNVSGRRISWLSYTIGTTMVIVVVVILQGTYQAVEALGSRVKYVTGY